MHPRPRISLALPLLMFLGCGDRDVDVGTTTSAILQPPGSPTTAHPEVGIVQLNVGSYGSGVLIRSHWVLTASHVFHFASTGKDTSGGYVEFNIAPGNTLDVNFDNAYRLTSQADPFSALNDLALVHLTNDVPLSRITPATLANRFPANGNSMEVVGYGCFAHSPPGSGGGLNSKAMAVVSWPTSVLCDGDSGGGIFFQSDHTLVGINGAGDSPDVFGDVFDHAWVIEAMIRAMEAEVSNNGAPVNAQNANLEYGLARSFNDYLRWFPVDSALSCKAICTGDPSCRAFQYQIAEQTCWLKNGVMPGVFSDDNVSGLPDEYIVGYNSKVAGGDIASFNSTDVNFCHYTCSNTVSPKRCVGWVVDTSTGKCYTKSSLSVVADTSAQTLGIIRTPENTTSRNSGADIETDFNSNVTNCTVNCAKNAACVAWSLDGTTCHLKSFVPNATQASGSQSGFRQGIHFYADFAGSDLSHFTMPSCPVSGDTLCLAHTGGPLLRPQVCQQRCQTTSGCKAWTLDIGTGTCYLKNGIPSLVTQYYSAITGTNTTALDW